MKIVSTHTGTYVFITHVWQGLLTDTAVIFQVAFCHAIKPLSSACIEGIRQQGPEKDQTLLLPYSFRVRLDIIKPSTALEDVKKLFDSTDNKSLVIQQVAQSAPINVDN